MSTCRQNRDISETSTQPKKLLSCFYINTNYPQIGCDQCNNCDYVADIWHKCNEPRRFKIETDPSRRQVCTRIGGTSPD